MKTHEGSIVTVARDVKADHLVLSVFQGDVCIAVPLRPSEWARIVSSGMTEICAIAENRERLTRHAEGSQQS